jgi:hypothetical protein
MIVIDSTSSCQILIDLPMFVDVLKLQHSYIPQTFYEQLECVPLIPCSSTVLCVLQADQLPSIVISIMVKYYTLSYCK